MATLTDIPTNRGGFIVGRYRLRHMDEKYAGGLGGVRWESGVTQSPVEGHHLRRMVAAAGGQFSIEPWDEETAAMPEVQAKLGPPPATEPVEEEQGETEGSEGEGDATDADGEVDNEPAEPTGEQPSDGGDTETQSPDDGAEEEGGQDSDPEPSAPETTPEATRPRRKRSRQR